MKKYPRENTRIIYECFNSENFRDLRGKNKTAILKEFSLDRIKTNFVKNWVKFLSQNKYWNGRWIFIDGEINLPKFLAASDMILILRRANLANTEHFIAMNYSCVPVVSRNGILNDTISDIFDDISAGCGFKTKKGLLMEEDFNELYLTPMLEALNIYQNNPNSRNLLIKNSLKKDFNWDFRKI